MKAKEERPAFCPHCNKGRQTPLPNTILIPTRIEDLYTCTLCQKIWRGDKEVEIEVKEKRESGQDLRRMIKDWYRCPLCHKVCIGDMDWASHTWQAHQLTMPEFERKHGKPEWSYYGTDFHVDFNPSEREK